MSNNQPSSESKSDSDLIEEVLEQVAETDTETVELDENTESATNEEVSIETLQKQLAQAEKKAAENWDKALRIQAEMEN